MGTLLGRRLGQESVTCLLASSLVKLKDNLSTFSFRMEEKHLWLHSRVFGDSSNTESFLANAQGEQLQPGAVSAVGAVAWLQASWSLP